MHAVAHRLAVLGVAVVALASAPAAAAAQGEASESVTWSVDPSDDDGPDGRAWIEIELDPGESITEHLAVRNLSGIDAEFALSAADGYFTEQGRFTMLGSATESTGAGTWIDLAQTIEIPAGDTVIVPFTLTVPANATPGDHAAGVAASVFSVGEQDGNAINVESRVGFRVMTRVAGQIDPALTIAETDVAYEQQWNPFRPGSVNVAARIVNNGNVAVDVTGTASAAGATIDLGHVDGPSVIELLPGEERVVVGTVSGAWPLFHSSVKLGFVAQAHEAGSLRDEAFQSVGVWTPPFPQFALLGGIAIIVAALVAGRKRQNSRIERLVEDARAAGRIEGSAP